jgi:hypothetical protein
MSHIARRFYWLTSTPAAYHESEQAQAAAIYAAAQAIIAGNYQ